MAALLPSEAEWSRASGTTERTASVPGATVWPIGTIRCPAAATDLNDGIVVIRPQAVRLHGPGIGGQNCYAGTVEQVSFLGDVVEGEVRVGAGLLKIVVDPYRQVAPGQTVTVELPPERCVLVPPDSGSLP